jgi:hypothetical protein
MAAGALDASSGGTQDIENSLTEAANLADEQPITTFSGNDTHNTMEENGSLVSPSPPPVTNWQLPSSPAAHPQAADIVRQIDFYFSDENLCQDPHLLGLMKEGNGTVSLNEILGFPKMRKYKPKSAVREAVRRSTVVYVSENGKRLGLRAPPKGAFTVTPKISEDRKKYVIPEDKPWLTKGLMKPTGFEPNATDGPLQPAEYAQDREDYDPDISFAYRIETAVTRFCARRKMHQETRRIWDKFMVFGGFDAGQQMFTGGLTQEEMENLTAKEIAERTAYYGVSERVMDGLYPDENGEITYVVDFEGVTKGFLSSQLLSLVTWYDERQVKTATNVLRNFYNYLMLHEVCPEYTPQLVAARKICDLAEEELPKLAVVDKSLPGGFNTACSTLFGGHYANLQAGTGDWVVAGDDVAWSKEDAKKVFLSGVAAYGTAVQLKAVGEILANQKPRNVVSETTLGLEVVKISFMTEQAKEVYGDARLANTNIHPMGLLRCKRWIVPHAPPMDLPADLVDSVDEEHEFVVEEEILKYCYPGLKMEASVKELDVGIKWIDYLETSYPSFFTWLANEYIRNWKEPGPPKAWMARQENGMQMVHGGEHEGPYEGGDDDEPD